MIREKTAVEWLVSRLKNLDAIDNKDVQQAKQMEKEQIELAFFEGKNDGAFMERYSDYKHITANEYYNETYGKDENKAENND